jgi:nucleotide-binding universal stress UspA family protein
MKTILVPTDFSAPAREAYKLALSIASQTNAEVIALNVIFNPVMYDSSFAGGATLASDTMLLEKDARNDFGKMDRELNKNSIKTSLEIQFIDIQPAVNIIIDIHKIDLVIMGTSGVSGMKKAFIGSNTEKVVRHSPVPVLAIHTMTDISTIKKILLPSTLDLDQPAFIRKVKELQSLFNATLEILLINTPARFIEDDTANKMLGEYTSYYNLKDYTMHFRNYKNVEEGIMEFAQEKGIDLIAMGTHARKGLAHLFNGSITEDVVNHIQYPVWTYPLVK